MRHGRHTPTRGSVDISERRGIRYLHFGSDWVQGAMRIARPWQLELAYTRDMLLPLTLPGFAGRGPRHVLLVGLGAGSQLKFLYRHFPECRITVLEIDPQVIYVAGQFFNVPDDPRRIRILLGDAADYLLACDSQYDLILLDGFDAEASSGALDTLPFYQACRACLSEGGLLSANLLGRQKGHPASLQRIDSAFSGLMTPLPPCDSGNVIVLAGGSPLPCTTPDLLAAAAQLAEHSGLELTPTLERLLPTLDPECGLLRRA